MYNRHETNHLFWSYSGDFSTDVAQALFILFSSPVPYIRGYHCVQAGILKMDGKMIILASTFELHHQYNSKDDCLHCQNKPARMNGFGLIALLALWKAVVVHQMMRVQSS